jgi:hypothetical protein
VECNAATMQSTLGCRQPAESWQRRPLRAVGPPRGASSAPPLRHTGSSQGLPTEASPTESSDRQHIRPGRGLSQGERPGRCIASPPWQWRGGEVASGVAVTRDGTTRCRCHPSSPLDPASVANSPPRHLSMSPRGATPSTDCRRMPCQAVCVAAPCNPSWAGRVAAGLALRTLSARPGTRSPFPGGTGDTRSTGRRTTPSLPRWCTEQEDLETRHPGLSGGRIMAWTRRRWYVTCW